jgi:ABC-2 type transport system ATP-binding protein
VLVSSHQLSEMSLMAEDLVVIGRGRLIDQCSVHEFVRRNTTSRVRVRSPQVGEILRQARLLGATVEYVGDSAVSDTAMISGVSIVTVGETSAKVGAVLHELTEVTESLEDAFLAVTADEQEYRSGGVA